MEPRTGRLHVTAVIAPLVLLAAAVCLGGIDNSHHDIRHYLPDKDACLVCHGRNDVNYYGTMIDDLGNAGGQCVFLCHSGKGILPETDTLVPRPGPSVNVSDYSTTDIPDYTAVFFTKSHGRTPGNLKDGEGQPVPWPPYGVNWQAVSADAKLECTSCHSVHDNAFPPFLHAPLGASYPDRDGFCDRCHADRATNNLQNPPDGMHPVDFPVDNGAAGERTGNGRHPRRIVIQRYGKADGTGTVSVFDVPNPAPAALNDNDASWSMGGHLTSGPNAAMTAWTSPGSSQQMGCYTCHSAHRTNVNGEKNLVVVKTADPERGWNPVCAGCHGAATSLSGDRSDWDVGTSGFGHPVGPATARDPSGFFTTTTGGFRFRTADVTHINPQAANTFGARGELLCTTCHKVHFGQPGYMTIANLGQGSKAVCKTCHSGIGIPNEDDWSKGGTVATGHNAANSHHVTATAVNLTGPHQPAAETSGPLHIRRPSWANASTGLGEIAAGMDCADCHTFNGTAHNW